MRSHTPTLHCDGPDYVGCDEWSIDYYAVTADTVDGVRITATERAPGWRSSDDDTDLCPEHVPTPAASTDAAASSTREDRT